MVKTLPMYLCSFCAPALFNIVGETSSGYGWDSLIIFFFFFWYVTSGVLLYYCYFFRL